MEREIGLPDIKKLLGMVSSLSSDSLPGKKNLRLFVEPGNDGDESGKLHGVSGQQNFQYILWKPELIMDRRMPESSSTCEVLVEGKDLVTGLKQAIVIDQIGKFLVSEGSLLIVSKNADDRGTARPPCRVLRNGLVDSKFDIKKLLTIRCTIEKSKAVTLGLGMGQPMTMDIKIDKMAIKYYIREQTQ